MCRVQHPNTLKPLMCQVPHLGTLKQLKYTPGGARADGRNLTRTGGRAVNGVVGDAAMKGKKYRQRGLTVILN